MPIRPENRGRYPADWKQVRERILARAAVRDRMGRGSHRCECLGECGRGTHRGRCPNVHGWPAYGTGSYVVLTIAHLDHTPENCTPENLRAMCQGCHLHYDREHHAATRRERLRAERAAAGQLTLDP